MQGPGAPVERNFTVLQEDEALRPGTVFGIDAEFVALSQPDKVLQGCVFLRRSDAISACAELCTLQTRRYCRQCPETWKYRW